MPGSIFDRDRLIIKSLDERKNQIIFRDKMVTLAFRPDNLPDETLRIIKETASRIIKARKDNKPVILAFGAHTIKNGLSPVLTELIRRGWVTHLATNGAGIIHDWEFAFQGESGENVRENTAKGQFGIWQETGLFLNLAITVGAFENLGYGESVGKMISREGLDIPDMHFLADQAVKNIKADPGYAASAADLLGTIKKRRIKPGFMSIPHPFKEFSVQCAAYELEVPFTGHPMIGHDIIYTHPANNGAAIGRTALRDFLCYAGSVAGIDGGVYLSIGSAVMSPMIFEKSLSMAQNVHIQNGRHIDGHMIVVVDLARNEWDWNRLGEPPADNPAYYLRYCKTFSRMGGEMHYLQADNRDFLCELFHVLSETGPD
ncbi:MAG: hypothetical protein KBB30_03640 [Bacteroidales bacterium]|jgi:hypothetical protein|nr:hypothetical protein [Bacteroidales bacterium]MDI9552909.1 hypothetical protein [Bacteroidota bacterium]